MVVNCAGRWTNEATREAGLHLPLAPTVGFLVFTPPVAAGLNRVVRTPVIDARPDGAGRLMLHWNPTDARLSLESKLSPSMPEARDYRGGRSAHGIRRALPIWLHGHLRAHPRSSAGPSPHARTRAKVTGSPARQRNDLSQKILIKNLSSVQRFMTYPI